MFKKLVNLIKINLRLYKIRIKLTNRESFKCLKKRSDDSEKRVAILKAEMKKKKGFRRMFFFLKAKPTPLQNRMYRDLKHEHAQNVKALLQHRETYISGEIKERALVVTRRVPKLIFTSLLYFIFIIYFFHKHISSGFSGSGILVEFVCVSLFFILMSIELKYIDKGKVSEK